jgi:hypothetical protein
MCSVGRVGKQTAKVKLPFPCSFFPWSDCMYVKFGICTVSPIFDTFLSGRDVVRYLCHRPHTSPVLGAVQPTQFPAVFFRFRGLQVEGTKSCMAISQRTCPSYISFISRSAGSKNLAPGICLIWIPTRSDHVTEDRRDVWSRSRNNLFSKPSFLWLMGGGSC